jgi:NADH-quinone oxidoreductase subunit L
MGNLRRLLPHIYYPFLIGALSLSAFPMIGGFFSKDRILLATFIGPGFIYKVFWLVALLAAFLTPLYTFRMFFTVFQDRPDGRTAEQIKPVPNFMAYILWPLALLALGDGLLNLPFGPGKDWLAHYLSVVKGSVVHLPAPPGYELYMTVGSGAVIVAVLIFTYIFYRPPGPSFSAPRLQAFLFEGLYLDKLYYHVFVVPYERLASILWEYVDEGGIDEGLDGAAESVEMLSRGLGLWATGRLSTYVKMLLVGLIVFFSALALQWFLW